MIDVHITLDLLEAVAEGTLPRETFHRLALEHALAMSKRAAAVVEAQAEATPPPPAAPGSYDQVFERVQANARAWIMAKSADESAARLDYTELVQLPSAEWSRKIQHSRRRFRSPSIAERLLALAKTALFSGRPNEVLDAARAAFWIARRLDGSDGTTAIQQEITWRASAYEAMASRAQGDLTAARRLFESVRAARARGELAIDPLAEAEVALFEGLFDRDDESFVEAEAGLLVALTTASALNAEADEAAARLAFARGLGRSGGLEEAIEALRPIHLGELAGAVPETLFAARLELAEALARLGRPRPASAAVAAARDLALSSATDLDDTAPGRLALTRGILAARRGWRPEGVRELEHASEQLAARAPVLAARAAVTLAEAALGVNRKAQAAAAYDRLGALPGLPAEPAAALAELLAQGPAEEEARSWLADLAAYLAAAQESPGLVFHRGYPGAQLLA